MTDIKTSTIVGITSGAVLWLGMKLLKMPIGFKNALIAGGSSFALSYVTPKIMGPKIPAYPTLETSPSSPAATPATPATPNPSPSTGSAFNITVTRYGNSSESFHYFLTRGDGTRFDAALQVRGFKTKFAYGDQTYDIVTNWGVYGVEPNRVRKIQVKQNGLDVKLSTIFGGSYEGKTFTISLL